MLKTVMLMAAAAISAPITQPGIAQASAGDEEIVVEGRNQKQRIREFVTSLTPARVGGQLGRFHGAVCPAAVGLPDAQNEAVVARLREVAAAVGVKAASGACTPNLFVVVAADKAARIAEIRRDFPGLVAGLSQSRLEALAASPGPSAAWHVVDEMSSDGTAVSRDSDGVKWQSSSQDPSRLRKPTVPYFLAAVVVVEAKALAGLSTRQLADYAAMRTLSPMDPLDYHHKAAGSAVPPAPSILTLLDTASAGEAPPSVTWWDFAFLKALYGSSNIYTANLQRGDIEAAMARTLAQVPEDER